MRPFIQMSRLLLAVGVIGAALAGLPAQAQTFQVTEGVVPEAIANTLTANGITFSYEANTDQTVAGGSLLGTDDPFTIFGFLSKASYTLNNLAVSSQLNAFGPSGYKIYGVFDIGGESDPDGTGGIQSTFTTLTMTLFLDPDSNTALSLGGAGVVVAGNGDDAALITYTLQEGESIIRPGLANGDFDTFLNVTLTPLGSSFFSAPTPFFPLENFGGNVEVITGTLSLTTSSTATLSGGGVELFSVPEPTSISLLAIGLLGVGIATRRRNGKGQKPEVA